MPTLVKTKSSTRAMQEDCPVEANDPVLLLRNEHSMLLGKLRLLEQGDKDAEAVKGLLQTIIRDSEVHFMREAILLHALAEKLEFGGRSFHRLVLEHETLLAMAHQLLNSIDQISGSAQPRGGGEQTFGKFAERFRAHIHHIEKVVYVLARTRLSKHHQKLLAKQILSV